MNFDLTLDKKVTARRLRSSKLDIDMTVYKGWAGAYLPIQLVVDESGLWLVAPNKVANLTIYKLDMASLKIIKTFVTDIKKTTVGPGFMVCGVWYALNSHDAHYVKYMYNTHRERGHRINIDLLPTPESDLVTLQYNPTDRHIYTWLRVITFEEGGGKNVRGTAEKYTIRWRQV